MADLTAFGLEPENDDSEESETDSEPVWSECIDCEYTGFEVKTRSSYSVPLCPDCFADREGLL